MNTLQLQDRSTKQTNYEKLKTQTHMALNFEDALLADRIYLPESKTHIVLKVVSYCIQLLDCISKRR